MSFVDTRPYMTFKLRPDTGDQLLDTAYFNRCEEKLQKRRNWRLQFSVDVHNDTESGVETFVYTPQGKWFIRELAADIGKLLNDMLLRTKWTRYSCVSIRCTVLQGDTKAKPKRRK